MKKKIIIHYKKRKIKVTAKDCNLLNKFVGLMFSRREKINILLFEFKRRQKIKIHSFFVFYPFIAIWLDRANKVLDMKVVKPFVFCVSPRKKACKLIEIPIAKKNQKTVKSFFPTRRNI